MDAVKEWWEDSDTLIGDHPVVEGEVLGIHARFRDGYWEYALTSWWYGHPTLVALFCLNSLSLEG